jgi:hypothetical protein
MHSDLQNMINSDPILRKFWSHILSFGGHYGNDTIGFALVCKYSKDIWVINEIQSDCLNNYLKLRSTALGWERKDDDKGGTTFEVLKDMLITNNNKLDVKIILLYFIIYKNYISFVYFI